MTGDRSGRASRLGRRAVALRGRAAVLAGVTVVALITSAAGFASERATVSSDITLTAVFNDAGALIVGNEVKVGGVTAGKIRAITLRDGKAHLRFTVGREFLPVHRDARATIKPVSLLGERYVDLTPGSPAAPVLPDGGVIPSDQTGRLTDLDEVLNVVDKPTGQALAATLSALGLGVQGQGTSVDQALKKLPTSMQDTKALLAILNDQNKTLTELIDAVTPVAEAVGADRGARLNNLVDGARNLLSATAREQSALESSLQQLPATLAEAQARLASLAGVADSATPVLASIRPVTGSMVDISAELSNLANTANPALSGLQPVLEKARTLVAEARPVAADLAAAAPAARASVTSVTPVASALIGDDAKLSNLLEFIRNWALTTNGSDGLSNYFRAHVIVSEETLMGPVPAKTPAQGVTKNLPPIGLPTPPAPALSALPSPVAGVVPGVVGGLPTPPPLDPGSATGLTPAQEKRLLGTMLGGGQ